MAVPLELAGRARWVAPILGATLVFNLVDLVATLWFVGAGYAVEANPFMALLLDAAPPIFAAVKLALVSGGVWILWRFRRRALARLGAVAVCVAYGAMAFFHAGWARALLA